MLLQRVPPRPFIGTATLFFAIVNLLKLPGYLSTGILTVERIGSIAWLLPLVPLGVWLGRKIILQIDPTVFEWLMLVLLAVASLWLLLATPSH